MLYRGQGVVGSDVQTGGETWGRGDREKMVEILELGSNLSSDI